MGEAGRLAITIIEASNLMGVRHSTRAHTVKNVVTAASLTTTLSHTCVDASISIFYERASMYYGMHQEMVSIRYQQSRLTVCLEAAKSDEKYSSLISVCVPWCTDTYIVLADLARGRVTLLPHDPLNPNAKPMSSSFQ